MGVRILIQKGFGGHEDPGRAITALRSTQIGERDLQRMKLAFRDQPFDREYLPSIALKRQHQAGKHRLSIEKDGASSALSELAPMLSACVSQVLAQNFQQRFIRSKGDIGAFAVQGKSNLRSFSRCEWERGHVPSPLKIDLLSSPTLARFPSLAPWTECCLLRGNIGCSRVPGLASNPRIR